jgi:hypothetical protein
VPIADEGTLRWDIEALWTKAAGTQTPDVFARAATLATIPDRMHFCLIGRLT